MFLQTRRSSRTVAGRSLSPWHTTFEIGLVISALGDLVDDRRTARVDEAIDMLDSLIHDIRSAAWSRGS